MPEETTTEAPETEAPVADAPEVTPDVSSDAPETEAPATEPETSADPFAEFGGADVVKSAHELYQATRSEDGVIQLFLEAGRALGLGTKEIESLFNSATEEAAPAEEEDPDRPITAKEFQEQLAKQQEAAATRDREVSESVARKTVHDTLGSLGIKADEKGNLPPEASVILNLGDRYMQANDLSPEAVAAAVTRGHADWVALVDKQAKDYVAKKAEQAKTVPSAPSGSGAPSTAPEEEPQNVQEAIKRARRMLGQVK